MQHFYMSHLSWNVSRKLSVFFHILLKQSQNPVSYTHLYFKSILSISDIQSILNPITDRYFGKGSSEMSLEDIYKEVFGLELSLIHIYRLSRWFAHAL